jgi:NADH-quinone oxidoreductase subunit J
MVNKLIFFYFAGVVLASALLMITRRNLVQSVLCMLLLSLHLAGIFVLLNAEFLATVLLLVSAVAVLLLFLSVVLLLNVDTEKSGAGDHKLKVWPAVVGALIAGELALLIWRGSFPLAAGQVMKPGSMGVKELGETLYKNYLVPIEMIALLLLVGLVGAVMLVKREKE